MSNYRYDLLIAYADALDKSSLRQISDWSDKAIAALDKSFPDDPKPMTPNERFVYDRFKQLSSACKAMAEILK